jgi:hypothetical protein
MLIVKKEDIVMETVKNKNMKNQQVSLKKMGYRVLNENPLVYAKPVGFHLLTFNIERKEFLNFFGKKSIWNSETIKDEIYNSETDFLNAIKNFEAYTSLDKTSETEFQFLSKEEYYESIL